MSGTWPALEYKSYLLRKKRQVLHVCIKQSFILLITSILRFSLSSFLPSSHTPFSVPFLSTAGTWTPWPKVTSPCHSHCRGSHIHQNGARGRTNGTWPCTDPGIKTRITSHTWKQLLLIDSSKTQCEQSHTQCWQLPWKRWGSVKNSHVIRYHVAFSYLFWNFAVVSFKDSIHVF